MPKGLVACLLLGVLVLSGCVAGPYSGYNLGNSGAPTAEFRCTEYPGFPPAPTLPPFPSASPYPRYLDATALDLGIKEAWVRCDASASYDPTTGASITETVRPLYVDGYHWDFGDGSFGSGVVATHSYGKPGAFGVTLTIFDDSGQQAQARRTVTVLLGALDDDTYGLAWDGSQLWVLSGSTGENLFYRVDPATGIVGESFPPPVSNPMGLTWDGTYLWTSSGSTIYKLDPTTGDVVDSLSSPGPSSYGLAWDGTYLWVSDSQNETIYQLDPATGDVINSFSSPGPYPYDLAWDGTYLWNVDYIDRAIYKLDPGTGEVVSSFTVPSRYPIGGSAYVLALTWDGAYLWVAGYGYDDVLYRVDPNTGAIVAP